MELRNSILYAVISWFAYFCVLYFQSIVECSHFIILVEPTKEVIQFEIHFTAEDRAWFAIGFSDRGEITPADYCILWSDWHLKVHFQDAWSDEKGTIEVDDHQDCKDFVWKRSNVGNMTKFSFTRKFDTCDDSDYIIERGTTHIVWSKGTGPLSSLNGLNVVNNAISSGMSRTELLRMVAYQRPKFPPDTWKYQLLADHVNIPDVETTYWCRVEKLPKALRQKHHVLQFGPVIQSGNEHLVHHMEVFHCAGAPNSIIPFYNGPCDAKDRPQATQVCKKVLAAWAMGADAFIYPKEAGLSVGGELFNQYIMLEVHYNNPERIKGTVDSSGIEFYLTKTLRKYDAGVIELGLEYTDKMAIPPHQELFELSGHCVTECTGIGLPQNGIFVFGSQLHTHLTGTAVRTRHIRDGNELSPLNYDNHYSTHFQEIRLLPEPVHILPGDSLITTCTYNTMERSNVTLGGFAISDEMCVNYIHYYPNARLEVCKSAISDDALRTYFRYMREWENQKTDFDAAVSSSYQNIEWTKVRIAALHDLYQAAPLGMQCNGSDGSRLPGLWNNVAATQVKLPLAPPARDCQSLVNNYIDLDGFM
ncbi:dopamine beta-hydroxylase isoform X2 [Microplitis demolitor]|uniref:dopamine beta-hydroxylase isoform X2 n=1 Tax=Microplitis demolitor TaxID=69319 RepID=UPI0004CD5DAD|nr:dopamine beta-hydroxylase isoform X2 [Microplitis demolitor]